MGRDERPDTFDPGAVKPHREATVLLLLDELVGATIPDLDGAGAVLARWDLSLEFGVVEGMVLDVHREVAFAGRERHSLGDSPAREDAVALEPEVVVEAAGSVPLNDEPKPAGL